MPTETIIQASGNGASDLASIQDALDRAGRDDVITLVGTFDLAGVDERGNAVDGTLYLGNAAATGLQLRGRKDSSQAGPGGLQSAILKHAMLKWGMSDASTCVPVSATVQNITFDEFTGTAIQVAGTVGTNRIQNCTFQNYFYKPAGSQPGAWPIRLMPLGQPFAKDPTTLKGTVEITGCVFKAPNYSTAPLGGMNNQLHFNNAHLSLLRIADNVIEDMSRGGISVWGIRGRTEIFHNEITLTAARPYTADGVSSAAITFGVNPGYQLNHDGEARIARNTITIQRPGAAGIMVQMYADGQYIDQPPTAREVLINDNVVHMLSPTHDGIALWCAGACSDADWRHNEVTGSARYGIYVSKQGVVEFTPSDSAPHDNTLDDNDLSAFTASQAAIFVDSLVPPDATTNISLRRNPIGPVSGSNLGSPPFAVPCAGIVSLGINVVLERNDFSTSGMAGWSVPGAPAPGPQQVGCIYLADGTEGNTVTWQVRDFPANSAPLPERQILNRAGVANEMRQTGPQVPEPVGP